MPHPLAADVGVAAAVAVRTANCELRTANCQVLTLIFVGPPFKKHNAGPAAPPDDASPVQKAFYGYAQALTAKVGLRWSPLFVV